MPRPPHVILSEAKDLRAGAQILRFAQDDSNGLAQNDFNAQVNASGQPILLLLEKTEARRTYLRTEQRDYFTRKASRFAAGLVSESTTWATKKITTSAAEVRAIEEVRPMGVTR